ncbi:MAG: hypothetical protein KAX49_21020 [Halanaerobiales bacterium]|nr:hypothetical protein [Halanaerobiales bacterium]
MEAGPVEVPIDPEEGGIIEYDDVKVEISAGAISDESGTGIEVTVHVTAIEETEIPKTDNLIMGKTYAFNLIDENNQPQQKVEFAVPVTLEFGYDKEMIPEGYSEFDLAVYHYDIRYATWVKMENAEIDPLENKIRIQTSHFSMLRDVQIIISTIPKINFTN